MTEQHDLFRDATGALIQELRARVWAWDPVGLADLGAPEDEYDCLVGPVSAGLRRGLNHRAIAADLQRSVKSHFGVRPQGTDAFVAELLAWYQGWPGEAP